MVNNMTDNKNKLKYIESLISKCQRCSLYKTATQAVPGAGNPNSKIVFIGEAPGYYEDKKGIPFIGNSGKLLDKLLASISLKREDIFICNILKHRPPDNRDPLSEEIMACTPFLKAQLKAISPKIIITLGRFSMNFFIKDVQISRIRGQILPIKWQGLDFTLIPVYHPSAGLRNGAMLTALQQDFKTIGEYLKKL
jgi:DNA polymerase